MFLVRKNDVSVAAFSKIRLEGDRIILINPSNIDFLYHALSAMARVEDVSLVADDTIKLHSEIYTVNLIEEGLELVILE